MKGKALKKVMAATVIIGVIVSFRVFRLGEYFSLSYIRESLNRFELLYADHRIFVIAAYMATYILSTSLSLPGAVVLTLAGGALFGLLAGTVIVSFASTIGATLACLVSRFILRDWVRSRFGEKLETVNKGIEKEGAFYLFTLRLVPVFPFWLINLLMGLTEMPLKTFFWISQIGMLAGTVVYVNAGRELSRIDSLSGIFSPGLVLSFIILGLFPITAKKLLNFYKSRKSATNH